MQLVAPESVAASPSLLDVFPLWESMTSLHCLDGVEMRFGLVPVTPSLAGELLGTQEQNRNINRTRVTEYSRRIQEGEWGVSDPIKFDVGGHLIDGQHRLNAIVRSKQNVMLPILSGYPRGSQMVIDVGMPRAIHQIAQIEGLEYKALYSAVVRAMFLVGEEKVPKAQLTSPAFIIDMYRLHQEAIDSACKTHGAGAISFAPIRAVVARAYRHEDKAKIMRFLKVLFTCEKNQTTVGVDESPERMQPKEPLPRWRHFLKTAL